MNIERIAPGPVLTPASFHPPQLPLSLTGACWFRCRNRFAKSTAALQRPGHTREKPVLPPVPVPTFGLPPLTVQLLFARGATLEEVERFASASSTRNDTALPVHLLPGLPGTIRRIEHALQWGERIAIHGDYDCDGVTATTVLLFTLNELSRAWQVPGRPQSEIIPYLPERSAGYDLTREAVNTLHEQGVKLLLTVDCGSHADDACKVAKKLGIDVIVSDHHLATIAPEGAFALLNPQVLQLSAAQNEFQRAAISTLQDLAGVGLAWLIAAELLNSARKKSRQVRLLVESLLDLVAIGTIADLVPLRPGSVNACLVRAGLQQLQQRPRPGLAALCQLAGLGEKLARKQITEHEVGMLLAPRLNASGRIGAASYALSLFTTPPDQIGQLTQVAKFLDELNTQRQHLQKQATEQAITWIEKRYPVEVKLETGIAEESSPRFPPVLVVPLSGVHQGVIGLVASHLVERYRRPALVFTEDQKESAGGIQFWRGSGRSGNYCHLKDLLDKCNEALPGTLTRYGGHAHAAGCTLEATQFENFTKALAMAIRGTPATPGRMAGPPLLHYEALLGDSEVENHNDLLVATGTQALVLDAALQPKSLTLATLEHIRLLSPFGSKNPRPVFSSVLQLNRVEFIGKEQQHLKLLLSTPPEARLTSPINAPVEAIGWNMAASWQRLVSQASALRAPGARVEVAYCLEADNWQQTPRLRLLLKDVRVV